MDTSAIGFSNEPHLWMDPRSKMALFMATNVAMFGGLDRMLEMIICIVVLLLIVNGKQYKWALLCGIIYFASVVFDMFLGPVLSVLLGLVLLNISRTVQIYMPIMLTAVFLIRTTTVSEFVAAFTRLKVTEKIIIPFSVMFRFFPTIGQEWNNISNAMKFRGISMSFASMVKHPAKTMEYVLVPLLMSSTKIAGELSAASLSRGLGSSKQRTCIRQIRFGMLDWVVVVFAVYVIVEVIIGRTGVLY